jgi:peptidoglycan-associated lipoprotein
MMRYIILMFSVLVVACSTATLNLPEKSNSAAVENRSSASNKNNNTENARVDAVPNDGMVVDKPPVEQYDDPINTKTGVLSDRSIYFDLDTYEIDPKYNDLLRAHGEYLAKHFHRKVEIQGNTDERGGAEYNLALGQKRADAVRRALIRYGAHDDQIVAYSVGKEKPRALGHDEESWAQNRRADLEY